MIDLKKVQKEKDQFTVEKLKNLTEDLIDMSLNAVMDNIKSGKDKTSISYLSFKSKIKEELRKIWGGKY